eukprot:8606334-Prorocentrum_lima.AAC.1
MGVWLDDGFAPERVSRRASNANPNRADRINLRGPSASGAAGGGSSASRRRRADRRSLHDPSEL